MGVMDQGMKAWVDLCTEDVMRWLCGPTARYLGKLPQEIAPAPQLQMDRLYQVQVGLRQCLVHLEFQAAYDATMDKRMFGYGSRAHLDHELPVLSFAIWLFRMGRKRPPRSPYEVRWENRVLAHWDFQNIELYRLPVSAIMNAEAIGLLPLAPFMEGATPQVVDSAMRRVKREAPEEQARSLAALLGTFSSRFHGMQFALDLVARHFMSTEILQEFPLFRMLMEEAEAKGMAEGKAEGERHLIRRMLERRFDTISPDVLAAINTAQPDTLPDLAIHAGTDTLEQFRVYLGLGAL
jgi:predicted transposase YdaD